MKKVIRLQSYRQSLRDLAAIVAKDNPRAAAKLRIKIGLLLGFGQKLLSVVTPAVQQAKQNFTSVAA